jgi:glycosyltransferase involved in cell wall biosynthesis
MKVIIDISVIGLGQLYETAKTGIYRVISSVSQELLKRDDLDVSFCSLSSIQVNQLTDTYFRRRSLEKKSFKKNSLEKLCVALAGSDDTIPQSEKVYRKILSRLYRMSQSYRIAGQTDIFHSMYSGLPRSRRFKKPTRILTIYDIIPLIHPEYFPDGFTEEFRPIVESIVPQRDFVVTISECSKTDICSYFQIAPERVFVTPLAASERLYYPETNQVVIDKVKKKFSIPKGRYFLTLATVEKRKNLATSIQCFREVAQQKGCEDLSFVLVGTKGWKVESLLKKIVQDPLLNRKVVFTGFIPDKYLSALYSGAEAFVYPSLYEGFGLPPLEAMQCGVPVITSNTSSLPEVVGDAGILVDPLDRDRIIEAMLDLLQNNDLRNRCVDNGLRRAAGFSWKICADRTVAGYHYAWNGR